MALTLPRCSSCGMLKVWATPRAFMAGGRMLPWAWKASNRQFRRGFLMPARLRAMFWNGMEWHGMAINLRQLRLVEFSTEVKHGETWWNRSTLHIFAPYHSGRGWIAVEAARRDHHPCVHVRVTESSQSLTGQSDRCGGKSGCRCGEKSGCWDVSKPRAWASIKLLCCENQGFDGFWPIDMQARRGLSENGVLYTQSQRIQTSFFASQCPPWWVLKPLRSRQLSWCVEPLTTRMCPRLVHGNWTLATQGSFRRFGVHSDPRKIYRKCHCGLLTFFNHEIWGAL